ncbi:hypothetical protein [Brevundimonas sp. NIBR11]|uniref:hypothetical protein n=1 Tax=Brevundimonas sp. NIBR11 TaxID=3015999 RepID=UPI0022F0DE3A|nr:hypothetical protein [Brevundimonas sp. NIBR11]
MTQGQGFRTRPRAVQDALNAYQTAAWRSPSQTRFDSRPANDFLGRAEVLSPRTYSVAPVEAEEMPRWLVIAIGALIAALLGALLGGMMAV